MNIEIEIIGWPLTEGRVLWIEDDGWGGKNMQVADMNFVDHIFAHRNHVEHIKRMQAQHESERINREDKLKG